MKLLFVFVVSLLCNGMLHAQSYDIVIKGGHVIDPKNSIDELMDVAINEGKIVKVAKNIDTKQAIQVVDAKGLYVTPGLIDIHTHDFFGTEPDHYLSNGLVAVFPDGFTFRAGVTTVVDAGGAGWKSFPLFKKNIIDNSQTRVLALLNVIGEGMRGGVYEQNTKDINPKMIAMVAKQYPNIIVGIKVAHFEGHEWTPVDSAVVAGNIANIPIMIDFGGANPPLPIEELFMKHLRPGDIFTHCYGNLRSREAIVDETTNKVKPFVFDARKRGIFFDVGYGGISFRFSQAIPALKQGFLPTSISTDLHEESTNGAMKDMLTCMSKFLAMGMDLKSVIKASTSDPAKEIKREELGNLSVGSGADVAILNVRDGKFGYFDYTGYKIQGNKKLECEMTIRDGRIVYDVNGIVDPIVVPRKPSDHKQVAH